MEPLSFVVGYGNAKFGHHHNCLCVAMKVRSKLVFSWLRLSLKTSQYEEEDGLCFISAFQKSLKHIQLVEFCSYLKSSHKRGKEV